MNASPIWYFDFVSPFAYLQWQRIKSIADVSMEYRPVLFAGLLNHYGHKGPAEVTNKRTFTYRHAQWRAGRADIQMRFPPAHPFNPLPALRLCVAAGTTRESIDVVFNFIWRDGNAADTTEGIDALSKRLGIADAAAALADSANRSKLQTNFKRAVEDGIFGVPSILLNSQIFWGDDSTEMYTDYLKQTDLFETAEMRRLSGLPIGAIRKAARQ